MSKVYMIAGLGFGDEGKGTTVDYLCARDKADLVVRYNGGAQAAHNVVTNDGRHHTFSQFGSGTFQGVPTFLSRFMFVDPLAMVKEAEHLKTVGILDPWDTIWIDRQCPIITPFHAIANIVKENARGENRHGTCGMGVGEAVEDWMAYCDEVPMIGDLANPAKLRDKLLRMKSVKDSQMRYRPEYLDVANSVDLDELVDKYSAFAKSARMVDSDFLHRIRTLDTLTIFEGAQGVLLDQDFGFQPHTTWSNTTFDNAYELLGDIGFDGSVTRIGITRSYQTRHGQGPMPTESIRANRDEPHNDSKNEQGAFRNGYLDMVLMRYAIDVLGGVDEIAVTHLDSMGAARICTEYNAPEDTHEFFDAHGNIIVKRPADYYYQRRLTEALKKIEEINQYVNGATEESLPGQIETQMNRLWKKRDVAVTIGSWGPSVCHKRTLRGSDD